jgi:hypothetical protein
MRFSEEAFLPEDLLQQFVGFGFGLLAILV